MIFIVSDARKAVAEVLQKCIEDVEVLEMINAAQERLCTKGLFKNLLIKLRTTVFNNNVCMPRGIEKIVKYNICGSPARIMHMGYELQHGGPGDLAEFSYGSLGLVDLGDFATQYEIPAGYEFPLMACTNAPEDAAVKIAVHGMTLGGLRIGEAGEEIQLNVFEGGVEGNINTGKNWEAVHLSVGLFNQVHVIRKPVTKGYVWLYALDKTNSKPYYLARIHPDETSPSFHRYKIDGHGWQNGVQLLILAKQGYVPAVRNTDPLVIQNIGAIKNMAWAIRHEASDLDKSNKYEAQAIRLMHEQDFSGSEEDPHAIEIDNGPYGTTSNLE